MDMDIYVYIIYSIYNAMLLNIVKTLQHSHHHQLPESSLPPKQNHPLAAQPPFLPTEIQSTPHGSVTGLLLHSRVHRAVLTFYGVCGGKREAINFDFFF